MPFKKLLLTLLLSHAAVGVAYADIKIGVISSATGPGALIGIPQKNSVPLLAPVGSVALVLPMSDKKKWVFKTTQNDAIIAKGLINYMAAHGVKTLGFIGTADAYGQTWAEVIAPLLKEKHIELVASERFQRTDTSVTAQALKLQSAKPEAILVAAPGGPAVLPQTTLINQGYKGAIYQTHGAALDEFLKLGGKKVEGTILATSTMLTPEQAADSNPSKKIAIEYINGYAKLYGNKPAPFGSQVFDAGILLQDAVPRALKTGAKPGTPEFRKALRDALETARNVAAPKASTT